jgi:hypothetical protein
MTDQMPVVVFDANKVAEIQASIPQLVEQAQEIEVVDNDDYLAAGAMIDRIEDRRRNITDFFDKPTKDANNVHKFLTSLRGTLLMPLSQAVDLLKKRRTDFRNEAERKRQQKEQEDREAARIQQEQQALQEAEQMAQIGEHAAADIILERAALAPPPPVVVPSTVPKEKGHSIRTVFKYRVTNSTLHKREFLILDESKVQTIVSRLGLDAATIVGGIEVYPEEVESVRRKT